MKQYCKPFKTFQEQLALLEERGIVVPDKQAALNFLKRVSYYKLSGYTLFFETQSSVPDERTHCYPPNISFDQIQCLYSFDKDLRILLYASLQEIEIAVKTRMTQILAKAGGPFALHQSGIFVNSEDYEQTQKEILRALKDNAKETFIKHHVKVYEDSSMPIWKTAEILTFGSISKIYSNLTPILQEEIAVDAELTIKTYKTWLHSFVLVRNICAHNGRLWNREISVFPTIFKKDNLWVPIKYLPKRIGTIIFCIKEMRRKHGIDNKNWKKEVEKLINGFACFERDRFLKSIGLFEGWEETDLWKR